MSYRSNIYLHTYTLLDARIPVRLTCFFIGILLFFPFSENTGLAPVPWIYMLWRYTMGGGGIIPGYPKIISPIAVTVNSLVIWFIWFFLRPLVYGFYCCEQVYLSILFKWFIMSIYVLFCFNRGCIIYLCR